MKLADFFTAIRIVLAPVFFVLFFIPVWASAAPGSIISVISVVILVPLFIFMEFTDYLDGYYARKLGQVSDFGKLFDPFADVLANLTVMFSFVLAGYLPGFFFLIIIYREMGILFVRMMAMRGGVAIGARKGGKAKTVLYIVAAGASLTIESALRLGLPVDAFLPVARAINLGLYVLAVIASVASFVDYLVHFAAVLRKSHI
jgi:CDP-diacylglycerol---glycerol-3-phosphate 3-phosphatidyltransferase